jgi:hypothetical protein
VLNEILLSAGFWNRTTVESGDRTTNESSFCLTKDLVVLSALIGGHYGTDCIMPEAKLSMPPSEGSLVWGKYIVDGKKSRTAREPHGVPTTSRLP